MIDQHVYRWLSMNRIDVSYDTNLYDLKHHMELWWSKWDSVSAKDKGHKQIDKGITRYIKEKKDRLAAQHQQVKVNSLRNKIIRLAHAKPKLRKHLLPILKEAKPYDCLKKNDVLSSKKKYRDVLKGLEACYGESIRERKVQQAWSYVHDRLYEADDQEEADMDYLNAIDNAQAKFRLSEAESDLLEWIGDTQGFVSYPR